MKSCRFWNRLWLSAILTLSVNVLISGRHSEAASPCDDGTGKLVVTGAKATQDPYWKYYNDCDRWGIEFAPSKLASAASIPLTSDDREPFNSSRYQKSPFQTVKYVFPKTFGSNRFSGNQAKSKFARKFAEIRSVISKGRVIATNAFERRIVPYIRQLEFAHVESATYPEFFLSQPQVSLRQRLAPAVAKLKAIAGLEPSIESCFHGQIARKFESQSVTECLRSFILRVLQKSTSLMPNLSSALKN